MSEKAIFIESSRGKRLLKKSKKNLEYHVGDVV